jgi:hypothetical protein
LHKIILPAVEWAEFGTDKILCMMLRGRWCGIVLKVHDPTEESERIFDTFPIYPMTILLGDLSAKVGRKDIFKPTIRNESLYEISSDNGVRIVNFATLKNLTVKSTMYPHRNIHIVACISPDENIRNQIDHILIDRRRHDQEKMAEIQGVSRTNWIE